MEDQNIATNLWYKDVQAKLEEKEKSSSPWDQLGVFIACQWTSAMQGKNPELFTSVLNKTSHSVISPGDFVGSS